MGANFGVRIDDKFSVHISTAGDDGQVLIWDISSAQYQIPGNTNIIDPALTYNAGEEITSSLWPINKADWIFISFGKKAQLLKV